MRFPPGVISLWDSCVFLRLDTSPHESTASFVAGVVRGSPYLGILRYLQKKKQAMPRSQGFADHPL